MPKFLVTYLGSVPAGAARSEQTQQESQQESQAFLNAWGEWAAAHGAAIVDAGAPVGRTLLVGNGAVTTTRNAIVAYSIVEAQSHAEAARMFAAHPHVTLLEGTSIEVMECLPIPAA